jgi:hypothetical protein
MHGTTLIRHATARAVVVMLFSLFRLKKACGINRFKLEHFNPLLLLLLLLIVASASRRSLDHRAASLLFWSLSLPLSLSLSHHLTRQNDGSKQTNAQ